MTPKGTGLSGKRPETAAGAAGLEEVTFEAGLGRLEAIVTQLERGEITLDESLAAFKEGSALVRHCLARLEAAEAAVQQLVDSGGEEALTPFDPGPLDSIPPGTESDA